MRDDDGNYGGDLFEDRRMVQVLFPLPLEKPYNYWAPVTGDEIVEGSFVRAPLGPREMMGVIWPLLGQAPQEVDGTKMKAIIERVDVAPLSLDVCRFVAWVANYTTAPLGAVLRLVMRSGDALRPRKPVHFCRGTGIPPSKMTPARQKVLTALEAAATPFTPAGLAKTAEVSDGVVRGLIKSGTIETFAQSADLPFAPPDPMKQGPDLSTEQQQAADRIGALMDQPAPKPILLDGVTGAGKTEVYLDAVARILRRHRDGQILIMLPEIALTLPFLKRIEERFGAAPAAWHSELSAAERRRVWRRVGDDNAQLVVGARSALFLPFTNLRLIVVDEEHESAYKQEDGVIYHGRDMAVARASLGKFPIVLASATPALETVVNVDQGRYELARLQSRFGTARLPSVQLCDMRAEPPAPGQWIGPQLLAAVNETLARGEQSLLFLNRRGYAPLTICRRCGHRMKAPDSDTWLVEHRFENKLVCHHTGFSMPKPRSCPQCQAVGSLSACGPGVERLAEEASTLWPDARVDVLSSDTAFTAQKLRACLQRMEKGETEILIATQVVAKGHHFPGLTLVGVVDADMGLAGGDLRGAERTYQLLSQVAGRAGRAEKPGRALLQTYQPEAAVLQALAGGHRDDFLAAEAAGRAEMGLPPYGRLAAVILKSPDEGALKASAQRHLAMVPRVDGAEVWGPAPAPIYRLRGDVRMRFLVKARRDFNIQSYLHHWLAAVPIKGSVRRTVDIDPQSFL